MNNWVPFEPAGQVGTGDSMYIIRFGDGIVRVDECTWNGSSWECRKLTWETDEEERARAQYRKLALPPVIDDIEYTDTLQEVLELAVYMILADFSGPMLAVLLYDTVAFRLYRLASAVAGDDGYPDLLNGITLTGSDIIDLFTNQGKIDSTLLRSMGRNQGAFDMAVTQRRAVP